MYKSHKIQLDPTNKQATLFAKSAGTARFAYNWALAQWQGTMKLLSWIVHYRTANIRKDWLHKLTFDIASNHNVVVIEDLNVKGMVKNRHLAKSISDAAFGEFRRQLEYKVAEYGGQLIVADRWFPSSKLCSACGTKAKSLPLNIREWTCHNCGVHHDRDLNAAINLAAIAGSSSVTACGEFSAAVPGALPPAQAASLKQELDNEQSLEVFV